MNEKDIPLSPEVSAPEKEPCKGRSDHRHAGHHGSDHAHYGRCHNGDEKGQAPEELSHDFARELLTIRSHSGLSGDMLFTGLAMMNLFKAGLDPLSEEAEIWLNDLCASIMPQLGSSATLRPTERFGIYGWGLKLDLPLAHEHRNLDDLCQIARDSGLSPEAIDLGIAAFRLLAGCEAEVHNKAIGDVHFHEVGALDSILDIYGVCELYCRLGCPRLISAPLPVSDGSIVCAHGVLPAPAPASLKLLAGLPVRPFEGPISSGELLTPTALALLHALHADFGPWPACIIENTVLVYGSRAFPDAPNGVIFALGKALA